MRKEDILEALRTVNDPELGFSIIDLGLVYDIKLKEKTAIIDLTLTTPTCPMGGFIISEVEKTVKQCGLKPVINLVFEPFWTPERMSKELRSKLNL